MESTKSELQKSLAAARKRGAADFNKDYIGKILVSFSCIEGGKRYAYFQSGGKIERREDATQKMIDFLSDSNSDK